MVLLRPHDVLALIVARKGGTDCNRLSPTQQLVADRAQRAACFAVNVVTYLNYRLGLQQRAVFEIIRHLCVYLSRPATTRTQLMLKQRSDDPTNSPLHRHCWHSLTFVKGKGLSDRTKVHRRMIGISTKVFKRTQVGCAFLNEKCTKATSTQLGLFPVDLDAVSDDVHEVTRLYEPCSVDAANIMIDLMQALTTPIATTNKNIGCLDTPMLAAALRMEYLSDPTAHQMSNLQLSTGSRTLRNTAPTWSVTERGLHAWVRSRGLVCFGCGSAFSGNAKFVVCSGSENKNVLCDHKCCATPECVSKAMDLAKRVYASTDDIEEQRSDTEPEETSDDDAKETQRPQWGWIRNHVFTLSSAPTVVRTVASRSRSAPSKTQSKTKRAKTQPSDTDEIHFPTAMVLSRTRTVERHVKKHDDGDGNTHFDPGSTVKMELRVESDHGWFPLRPGKYKFDECGVVKADRVDGMQSFLHGTVIYDVYAANIRSRNAQLVRLSIHYRDGNNDGQFGSWPRFQLVHMVAFEWSYTLSDELQVKTYFLTEVSNSTGMQPLLARFQKRYNIAIFCSADTAMTEIEAADTTTLIKYAMKQAMPIGTDVNDIAKLGPSIDSNNANSKLVVSAALLRSLRPLSADSSDSLSAGALSTRDAETDTSQATQLTSLFGGVSNLLYKVYGSLVRGDTIGAQRTICIQTTADNCDQVPFHVLLRTIQQSTYL